MQPLLHPSAPTGPPICPCSPPRKPLRVGLPHPCPLSLSGQLQFLPRIPLPASLVPGRQEKSQQPCCRLALKQLSLNNWPLKGVALWLAPPPNHCTVPSFLGLLITNRFVVCSPPGSKRSSYPCPLSAQTHPVHTVPPSSRLIISQVFLSATGTNLQSPICKD